MKMFPSGYIRGQSINAMPSRQIAAIFQSLVDKGCKTNKKYNKPIRKQIPGQCCLFDATYNPLI